MAHRRTTTSLASLAFALAACSQEGLVGSLKENGATSGGEEPATSDSSTLAPTRAISAGGSSTCVRSSAGDLRCWGENDTGSLGIGDQDPTESPKPMEPSKVGLVTSVFSGEQARCAIRPDGKVLCWGTIAVAIETGSGLSPITPMPVITPFSIDGVTGPIARMAIGRHFMCTLGEEGDVRCFGLNQKGQLGLGSTEAQHVPTTVKGFDAGVVSIAASMGGLFACAATSAGTVYCWGDNTSGAIGGGLGASVLAPRAIEGLPGKAVEVVAGGAHACARLDTGKIACWGSGTDGQLGDGTKTSSATPVVADVLTDVVAISAGKAHTCAVRSEGAVYCWGANDKGQAGPIPEGTRPWLAVDAVFRARAVSCGLGHTCAWGEGGRVKCWGDNGRAQLGPETATF